MRALKRAMIATAGAGGLCWINDGDSMDFAVLYLLFFIITHVAKEM